MHISWSLIDCDWAFNAGNILDNLELVSTLEEAKSKAADISEKLEKAKVTSVEIEEVRVRYTPAAKRGAILFFVMASLSNITNMYEYSLAAFLNVYGLTLLQSKKDPNLDGRLRNIIEAATFDVYNYTCLGLFEKHKLMFSFQMTLKLLDGDGKLNQEHLNFFLKGNLSLEKSERRNPYSWFPDTGWQDLMRLIELGGSAAGSPSALNEIADSVETAEEDWKTYFELEAPEQHPLPAGLNSRLNSFEQLLVLRCIRMDRVTVQPPPSARALLYNAVQIACYIHDTMILVKLQSL